VQPYTILQREFTATTPDGKTVKVPVKVGVIGFTTPGIMNWDKRFVEGKLRIDGAVETAQKYLPEMRQKGADVVVALVHGGLSSVPYSATMENPALHLSKVPGIDAMFMATRTACSPIAAPTPPTPWKAWTTPPAPSMACRLPCPASGARHWA
jgi:2',3'-cyclic-nucleotide 2'-phosphodiesterase/3'-nucleotidase